MIVVAVIGIIATITVVGFGNWQKSISQKQLQSDLKQASVAMENAKNFGTGYPTSIPSSFDASSDVTLSYISGTSTGYCIQAVSTKDSSIAYHIDTSQGNDPIAGICTGSAPTSPAPSIASATTTTLTVTWPAVSGATSYSVKYGTSSPTTTAPGCSSSPCVISGLSVGTLYYVNVTATNAVGSTTSSTISGWTALQNPASYTVTKTSGFPSGGYVNITLTGGGGACSQGSTEWKFLLTAGTPDFGTATWQTTNTKTYSVITNGFVGPDDYVGYARARCNNGNTTSVEGSGYASSNGI